MSVNFEGEKKIILDKSLTEILKIHHDINNDYVIKFLKLMRKIGVDYFEVSSTALDKLNIYPEFYNYFVYKIESMKNLKALDIYNFKYLSIDFEKIFSMSLMDYKNKINKSKVIINVRLSDLEPSNMENIKHILCNFNVECLMVTNLCKCNNSSWKDFILKLKNIFNFKIGFCAENLFYMGTAISIEACLDGADIIVGAFNGAEYGLTPLEELLTALKVMISCDINGDLSLLSRLTDVYKELTYKSISGTKPVIGKDIFKYESGIHADGIEKNPLTYEPYNPEEVGQKRELLIGKHSGTKAILTKLKQLNVNYGTVDIDLFLTNIRNKSIYLKRSLRDEEFLKLYEEFVV